MLWVRWNARCASGIGSASIDAERSSRDNRLRLCWIGHGETVCFASSGPISERDFDWVLGQLGRYGCLDLSGFDMKREQR